MKKLLILGGGSKRNQAWGESCREYFKDRFDYVHFIQYEHWITGESNIDFQAEINKIAEIVKSSEEGEWYIYAKSIGSILTLKAVAFGAIVPTKCVFFGVPFSVISDTVVKNEFSIIQSFSIPTIAFHNDNDPTAIYEQTKKIVEENMPTITLKVQEGDNHDYLDFSLYESEIDNFITTKI